jgi:hypothetical protein
MSKARSDMSSRAKILKHWSKVFDDQGLHDVVCNDEKGCNTVGCFACGSSSRVERAHIEALTDGGSNDVGNLHLLCRSCHHDSEAFSGNEYMEWFQWRLTQPGWMAARLSMLASAGKLPAYQP